MIEYRDSKPELHDYKELFESTGWTESITISEDTLEAAIKNSWKWVTAYDDKKLIGIGRLISDGALYAFVCDMIVLPEYQKQGIGSTILNIMKDKCIENNIQRIWLFAAPGRSDFYTKSGFDRRPENAPGMQMINC